METDSFFCQFFKQLPETMWELLGKPMPRADAYRFDAVELKKSLRIDGLYLPKKANMPLYFLEVQFQRLERFYANLFAKVFCFLDDNRPEQEWFAVAIFANRGIEPRNLGPYEDLLASKRVKRIYLDELDFSGDLSIGMRFLKLLQAAKHEVSGQVGPLIEKVRSEIPDADRRASVIELVEALVMRLIPEIKYEEVRAMVLHDIRKSKAWQEMQQEARQVGLEEGRQEGRQEGRHEGVLATKQEIASRLFAEGRPLQEIAKILGVSTADVRKWLSN